MTLELAKAYTLTPTGLILSRALKHEEWALVGRRLAAVFNGMAWAIGDWLIYGQVRNSWGDTYTEAELITGRSLESLSQYARVAEAFPPPTRVPGVPWSLHREALRAPPECRPQLLLKAKAERWQRQQLAGHINVLRLQALTTANEDAGTTQERSRWNRWPAAKKHHVQCPHCGWRFHVRRKRYGLAPYGLEAAERNRPRGGAQS
jgi:hypothetical protein